VGAELLVVSDWLVRLGGIAPVSGVGLNEGIEWSGEVSELRRFCLCLREELSRERERSSSRCGGERSGVLRGWRLEDRSYPREIR